LPKAGLQRDSFVYSFLNFLLVYNSCIKGEFIVIFPFMDIMYPWFDSSSSLLLNLIEAKQVHFEKVSLES
jgi:hypothetical protein